jgi:hypothetical protein
MNSIDDPDQEQSSQNSAKPEPENNRYRETLKQLAHTLVDDLANADDVAALQRIIAFTPDYLLKPAA